jgi:hypothetical protein
MHFPCILFYTVIVVYEVIRTRSFSYDSTKFFSAVIFKYSGLMMTVRD